MKRVFLRTALLCEKIVLDAEGEPSLIHDPHDTLDISAEAPSGLTWGPVLKRALDVIVQIVPWDRALFFREHLALLRFVDVQNRYLPGEFRATFPAFDRSTQDPQGWRIITTVVLHLEPPRSGDFRLLVEFDGELIGWIPFRALLTATTKGDS